MKFADLREIIKREIGEQAADRVCDLICAECAGERVYVPEPRRPPEIKPNETPAQVARKHGVSRQTGYNWVNRWRR